LSDAEQIHVNMPYIYFSSSSQFEIVLLTKINCCPNVSK